jgi:hypothetical protein
MIGPRSSFVVLRRPWSSDLLDLESVFRLLSNVSSTPETLSSLTTRSVRSNKDEQLRVVRLFAFLRLLRLTCRSPSSTLART